MTSLEDGFGLFKQALNINHLGNFFLFQTGSKYFSDNHDFVLCYAKNKEAWRPVLLPRTEKHNARYSNSDNDPRGPWASSGLDVKTYQEEYDYPITTPSGRIVNPPGETCWRYSKEKFNELVNDNRIWFGEDGDNVPRIKRFLRDVKQGITPLTVWLHTDVGHTQSATQGLNRMGIAFPNPKPHTLLKRIFQIGTEPDSIVLDSFAGSGTTAHAVLALNKEDGGNRKFILIECEDYADSTTAERVRRVINGIPNARNTSLREGLGGSFTYCTLRPPMEIEGMLTGDALPTYETLAAYLLHIASGITHDESRLTPRNDDGLFYRGDKVDYYMLYKPNLDYLCSNEAMLTQDQAERIRDDSFQHGKKATVYAAGKYISQKDLTLMGITFCQLPHALHQR